MTLDQLANLKRGDKVRRINFKPALIYVVTSTIYDVRVAVHAGLFPPTKVTDMLVGNLPAQRFTQVARIESSGWIIGAEVVAIGRAEDWEIVS